MRLAEWWRLQGAKRRDPGYFVRLQALVKLRDQARQWGKYPGELRAGQREAWILEADTVLPEVLGDFHPLIPELEELWGQKPRDAKFHSGWEARNFRQAEGVLNAAITSYIFMNTKIQDSSVANALDADLMARVEHVFRVEDWTAVASLASTFVEDRFRTWAGLDHTAFGVNLMTKVLHPDTGVFPLGVSSGEIEGWHQLGRGFMSACSNVDRHRIQSRDDLRKYAVGVLGTASLLLTQMRYQHGNRFKS